jgi:hypothetical protein
MQEIMKTPSFAATPSQVIMVFTIDHQQCAEVEMSNINSGYNSGENKQQKDGGNNQKQQSESQKIQDKVQKQVEQVHRNKK